MSTTRPPDRLRGNTPARPARPTQEYGPTKPAREAAPTLPAELSGMHEMLREALAEVFSERSASAESMIAARVKVDTARGLKNYKGALGAVGTLLVGFIGWAVAEVRSYGDERVAAYEAKAEAKEAAGRVEKAHQRIDDLEGKVDRILAAVGRIESAEAPEPTPVPIVVPIPKPKTRARP